MLALIIMFGTGSGAQDYSLSGSILTFDPSGDELDPLVILPVHDLGKAAPELAALEQEQLNLDLPPRSSPIWSATFNVKLDLR